jgi:phosphopantetheinyl transferase
MKQAYVRWAADQNSLEKAWQFSVEEDHNRAGVYELPRDQRMRCAAYGLCRQLLLETGLAPHDAVVEKSSSGQPFLNGFPNLSISISHSALGVVTGLGLNCEIGVDIEEQQEDCVWSEIAQYFAPTAPRCPKVLLSIWTASEACAKSHGVGMPAIFDTPLPVSPNASWTNLSWQRRTQRDVQTLSVPGGCLAYAVSAGTAVDCAPA